MECSAIELCQQRFPGLLTYLTRHSDVKLTLYAGQNQEDYRTALGRFGLSGDIVFQSIETLSGGQKSRLAFALLGLQKWVQAAAACLHFEKYPLLDPITWFSTSLQITLMSKRSTHLARRSSNLMAVSCSFLTTSVLSSSFAKNFGESTVSIKYMHNVWLQGCQRSQHHASRRRPRRIQEARLSTACYSGLSLLFIVTQII